MRNCLIICAASLLISLPLLASDWSIQGTTDKKVAIYKPGEDIVFTLQVLNETTPVEGITVKWTRTGDDGKVESGECKTGASGVKAVTRLDRPGFVRLQAFACGEDGKKLQGYVGGWGTSKTGDIFFDGGACVEPESLRPIDEPKDFDVFWKAAKAKLESVPIRAVRKEMPSKNPKVKVYEVSVDCAGPRPVTGYLTIPTNAAAKSLPGIVTYQGYGVYVPAPPESCDERAICLAINAHGLELGKDAEYYNKMQTELKDYCFKNDENKAPQTSYYYGMALRVMRALQYVKSLPEWNGKELQSNGGSQGGLQGLWGAALDDSVTSCDIWSPWCCDFGGGSLGRQRGFGPDYQEALNYFDPAFHAKRIKAKTHLIANLGDYTCPPSGVWIVYNNLPGDKKSMEVKQGCTHGFEMKNGVKFTVSPAGIEQPKDASAGNVLFKEDFQKYSPGSPIPAEWKAGGWYSFQGDGSSIWLSLNGGGSLCWHVPLNNSLSVLKFSCRIRARGVVRGNEVWQDARIALEFQDSNGKHVGDWPAVPHVEGNGDWITFEQNYKIPPTATRFMIAPANFGAGGVVDFDDILLIGG